LLKNTNKKQVKEQDIKNLTSVAAERELLAYDEPVKDESLGLRICIIGFAIMFLPFLLIYY